MLLESPLMGVELMEAIGLLVGGYRVWYLGCVRLGRVDKRPMRERELLEVTILNIGGHRD